MRFPKKILFIALLTVVCCSLSGCLTCDEKEYTFTFITPSIGKLTIKYKNIYSVAKDNTFDLDKDYEELINFWLKGQKLEKDFPKAKNIKKRLFEENGTLCGEVTMDFYNIKDVRLFRYADKGPYMFSLQAFNDDNEELVKSNGTMGGDQMPVLFWEPGIKKIKITTKIGASENAAKYPMLNKWEDRF